MSKYCVDGTFKVSDLINMNISVDVYDNVCDDIAVCLEGNFVELTEEGQKEFAEVLDYEVEKLDRDIAIINIDFDDWEDRLEKAKRFFWSLAGYCSEEDYDKWFIEKE